MKILYLADNFPPEKNAQASRVYERACYWGKWGHLVSVITCFPNYPEGTIYPGYKNRLREVSEMDGIRVVRVKTFMAANVGKLLRILDYLSFMISATVMGLFEPKPDLVAANSPHLFSAVAACVLAAIHRVPFVMEVADLWPDSIVAVGAMKRRFAVRCLEKLELWLYRRAKRVVALTESFKANLISRGVDPTKVDVVINGVDLPRYTPRERDAALADSFGIRSGDFVVGYVGTIGMAHSLENVLEAAKLTNGARIRFLLVGPGAEREKLAAKVADLGLTNVTIAPSQPKDKMPAVWSICDVALVHLRNTKVFESVLPSKIFEAMAMGLPILLASPEGEAKRLITSEGCGVAIRAEDPAELAAAAISLANDARTREYLAAKSLRAAPKYTRERQARSMILSLEQAISGELALSAVPTTS